MSYKSKVLDCGNKYRFIRFRSTEYDVRLGTLYISDFGMAKCTEQFVVPEVMPARDIVVDGEFSVNNYAVKYKVDGVEFAVDTVAFGDEIVLPDNPTKEGYTFSGWVNMPSTMPANDIIVEGMFTINSYTITYVIDGEVFLIETVLYGDNIVLIDAPTKEGYTFSGWSEAPIVMPAEDIVIEGEFIKIETIINNVKADDEKGRVIYDLKGNRILDVENLETGFYIIDGKKEK